MTQTNAENGFVCPVCRFEGPFETLNPSTGPRIHARCPSCGALERHRLQHLVMEKVLKDKNTDAMRVLHFAPERFFQERFSKTFTRYETADLDMKGVDHLVDLQSLPFENQSYDLIFASHVLEHIKDDNKALSEIRRVLKPGGIAVLPVPLVAEETIEYAEPNPDESFHVRAPGPDYYNRYEAHFRSVDRYSSESFPKHFQLYVHENRARWAKPSKESQNNTKQADKHLDVVPVCFA